MPCRGGSSTAPAENLSKIERKQSTVGSPNTSTTVRAQTPTYTTLIALSPLTDTTVTTTLFGETTASITASVTSSPKSTLPNPLLSIVNSNPESAFIALSNELNSLLADSSTSTISATTLTSNLNINLPTGILTTQQQSTSPSNLPRVQSHVLTLPLIDEDDEDENSHIPLPLRSSSHLAKRKVQNENLISINEGNSCISKNSNLCNVKSLLSNAYNELPKSEITSLLTPSPKIKAPRIKFNQSAQQQSQQPLLYSHLASISVDPESPVTIVQIQEKNSSVSGETSPNKMQAESGSIAELQKYQNKYLKNRRHTLANTAAITLR